MRRNDRILVLAVGLVAVAALAWFLVLAPKRKESARLGDEKQSVQAAIAKQEQIAAYGQQARRTFPHTYQELVVLGKAVPAGDDTSAMLVELSSISHQADVKFGGIALSETGTSETAAPTSAPSAGTSGQTSSAAGATTASLSGSAPATEAAAASLPIGATVGPAGLPVQPYQLHFIGSFFKVADFIAGLDDLVGTRGQRVVVDGRLMTIDGFALSADQKRGFPTLDARFTMTAYVTPAEEGLFLGASPSAPSTTGTTQVSATVPSSTSGGTP